MQYRLLLSDIDGTLRPGRLPQIPTPNVEAVRALQRYGVKFAIATGRARSGVPEDMLNGLEPDYWICAAGAQVLDRGGRTIADSRMEPEQMEALTAFCREEQCPLMFAFSDGAYAYSGYETLYRWTQERGLPISIRNGEDAVRHLTEMPFSASSYLPQDAVERFQTRYSGLALRFAYYGSGGCDILRPGQDKAQGLAMLLEHTGLRAEECVGVGDGNNDVELLRAAGLGFCVEGGARAALEAADRICPPAGECGVATVCRMVWPEAF